MVVGDEHRFAIDFEVDAGKQADAELAPWLYGRIRWWCHGQQIGRYEDDTTIRDVALELTGFLAHEGHRQDEHLASVDPDEAYRTLVHALYDDHGQSTEQIEADEERYRRLVVKPQVDAFDPWDIFLVEGTTTARLIWRRQDEASPHWCDLAPGEFDRVARGFLAALPIR
jgi:hypothetical protein